MSARRPWAWPLVPVYRAALAVKDALRGEPKRLQWPVVSVGSLSAGGAGKTPVVIALALLLKERGWSVDVLSRGYGREGRGIGCVEISGGGRTKLFQADEFSVDIAAEYGDEPMLIASRAGVGVWVGPQRLNAGLVAERDAITNPDENQILRSAQDANQKRVHLLDDGFQHRQLARAMDVVLVTAEDMDDALLPAGNLREPMSALRRADVVVVREEEIVEATSEQQVLRSAQDDNQKSKGEEFRSTVWGLIREGAQMWVARRKLVFPNLMKTLGAGLRPVAFCAIARPENFAAMLLDAGCGVVETIAFADHHRYTKADVQRVIEVANGLNASGFVTTEKDAVKLPSELRTMLEAIGPLMVVALEVEFVDANAVIQAIEARIS